MPHNSSGDALCDVRERLALRTTYWEDPTISTAISKGYYNIYANSISWLRFISRCCGFFIAVISGPSAFAAVILRAFQRFTMWRVCMCRGSKPYIFVGGAIAPWLECQITWFPFASCWVVASYLPLWSLPPPPPLVPERTSYLNQFQLSACP